MRVKITATLITFLFVAGVAAGTGALPNQSCIMSNNVCCCQATTEVPKVGDQGQKRALSFRTTAGSCCCSDAAPCWLNQGQTTDHYPVVLSTSYHDKIFQGQLFASKNVDTLLLGATRHANLKESFATPNKASPLYIQNASLII